MNAGAGGDGTGASSSSSASAMAEYSAYINFDASATPDVRLGMSVIVYTADGAAAEGPFSD